jgi:hypothetical protein
VSVYILEKDSNSDDVIIKYMWCYEQWKCAHTPNGYFFSSTRHYNITDFDGLLHYHMTLRTAPSDRDVRTRSAAPRVDHGTRYVTICVVSLVVGRSGGKRYMMRRMESGMWGGVRETVKRKRKLSAVFLQPIQNPSYMSHVLLLCISFLRVLVVLFLRVTFICVA